MITKKIFGKHVWEYPAEMPRKEEQETEQTFQAGINSAEYIKIPSTNIVIAINQTHNGMDYENTHKAVLNDKLIIPTPALWSRHLANVIEAYEGKATLHDAAGNVFPKDEVNELYKKLTGNCWIWLNARFVEGSGFNNLDLETINGIDSQGNLTTIKEPLEKCLLEDCYAELQFNKQGMPIKKSGSQEYKQGENICYWYPRADGVAWFGAGSGGACLDCGGGYPGLSISALGVFAVADAGTDAVAQGGVK